MNSLRGLLLRFQGDICIVPAINIITVLLNWKYCLELHKTTAFLEIINVAYGMLQGFNYKWNGVMECNIFMILEINL